MLKYKLELKETEIEYILSILSSNEYSNINAYDAYSSILVQVDRQKRENMKPKSMEVYA